MSDSWLKCKVKNNEFSNCNDLLSKKQLTKVFWFIGTFTCLMNLISIVIHVKLFSQLQRNKFLTVFRWFKFTLKPPYSIAHDKLRLAIWDTSFWTFWLKFGHKGP